MVNRKARHTAPVCYMPDGRLICYHRGRVVIFSEGKQIKSVPIVVRGKERFLGWNRFLTRLFRLGVRIALPLDENHVILSIGSELKELDIENGVLSDGWDCGEGVRPLVMNHIDNIEGFRNGVYFGGYVHNPEKKPVHIYRRMGVDQWELVYSFPHGAINHVHNVVSDPFRHCVWVFTGDFDDAAAIWKASDGFSKVERIAGGNQKWRGSVVFVLPEGLLYATDTPRADNYLYLLNPDTMELKEVMPLDGSCIYGCKWNENYVLSTTVESNGGNMNFWENWFGRKRGDGIKDEYVHLYCGNLHDGFHEIYKEKKDWLPFTLFRFGVFKIPANINNTDTLYFQPVATNKNDQRLMCLKELDNK